MVEIETLYLDLSVSALYRLFDEHPAEIIKFEMTASLQRLPQCHTSSGRCGCVAAVHRRNFCGL